MTEFVSIQNELTEMIRICVSDFYMCKEDIENLEVDFKQRELKNVEYDVLSNDEKKILEDIKLDMLFFRKRTFIKTIFSNIEGILYRTKQILIENKDKISDKKDLINLFEIKYKKSLEGKQKEIKVYPGFFENIKLVFKYYKIFYSQNYVLENFYTELNKYENVKYIRNKITHPKHIADLKITDDELKICNDFYFWFFGEYRILISNES